MNFFLRLKQFLSFSQKSTRISRNIEPEFSQEPPKSWFPERNQ